MAPEVKPCEPPLYSFLDLLLLRSIVFLRAHTSSPKIHKAFENVPDVADAEEHPSKYTFVPEIETEGAHLIAQQLAVVVPAVGEVLRVWPDRPTAFTLAQPLVTPFADSEPP